MRVMMIQHTPMVAGNAYLGLGVILARMGFAVELLGFTQAGKASSCSYVPGFVVRGLARPRERGLPRVLLRAMHFFSYYRQCVRRGRQLRPRVVVAFNYDSLFVASRIASLTGASVLYYVYEYSGWPTLREVLSGWGIFKILEKLRIGRADYVASVEPVRARLQARQWGFHEAIPVVLNCPLRDDPYGGTARLHRSSEEVCRFVYTGALRAESCIDEVIRAFIASDARVSLTLYGLVYPAFQERLDRLLCEAEEAGKKVRYGGLLPYAEVRKVLFEHDVGVCLYRGNRLNERYCAPGKLYQYLSAGLAVIVPDFPGMRNLLSRYEVGVAASPTSVRSITEAVETLAGDRNGLRRMQESALQAYETELNYEHQSEPVVDWISAHRAR